MDRWVEVTFDCIPLRSIPRLDAPIDASPKFQALCESIKRAIETHGAHNAYFLYNARCVFHLTNNPDCGTLHFRFEGTALTDASDQKTARADLQVELVHENCDWLTETVLKWFQQTVPFAVRAEFDRYIAAGDLEKTRERLAKMQAATEQAGGFVGMYL